MMTSSSPPNGDGNPIAGWRNGTNELFHDIQLENQLLGFQLGANMNYCLASRRNFFWDTNFGLYNNHINQISGCITRSWATSSMPRMAASLASIRPRMTWLSWRNAGRRRFPDHASRRGRPAYLRSPSRCGASAPDQIRPEYNSWTDTARINADGSIFIHGVQAGIECSF